MYLSGYSLRRIADELFSRGIKSPLGKERWSAQYIDSVLSSKKYIDIVSFADSVRSAYTNSEKMRNTIAVGAAFSLLIALLGLVGFIRDEAQRRSKEIAVRKINGATTRNFISDFASDIMKLALLMAVLACAGAYFTANIWLEQFAEKVALNPLYFISGTLIVLTIVLAVIIINCLKIARQNPVISLKSE